MSYIYIRDGGIYLPIYSKMLQDYKVLKLKSKHSGSYSDPMNRFNEPTVVPRSLLTLEIFEWRQYDGAEQERKMVAYILAKATCLKMATFSTRCGNKYQRLVKNLKSAQSFKDTFLVSSSSASIAFQTKDRFSKSESKNMVREMINELPDDLLIKILSSLPVKQLVETTLISKRWRNLWKLVSVKDLRFDDESFGDYVSFKSFVNRYLLFNKTQVLERLHLKLRLHKHRDSDINGWVQTAVNRSVEELRINMFGKNLYLPTSLSACKTLKTLKLRKLSLHDVSSWFRLPSLKSLHLLSVKFLEDECVENLLGNCPVLEDLVVYQTELFDIEKPTWSTFRTLKTLILGEVSIKVVPHWLRLSLLKTLQLLSVKFLDDESVGSFLKICPLLERLVVDQTKDNDVKIFSINVPTLRSLSINNSKENRLYTAEIHGFVIKAPSLMFLNIKDTFSNFLIFEYMPEVIKANIEVKCDQSEKFIGSLTSIQQLSYCSLNSKTPYPTGRVFFYLEHLELCTCSAGWWNLLSHILEDAPRLQSLKLKLKHDARYSDLMNLWEKPKVVPNCLSKHLEILEWRQYEGTKQEIDVAAYILANATCLKMATFSTSCSDEYYSTLKKLMKSAYRVSETCQLVFD